MLRRQPRDPRQARFLTWASLRWVVRNRAWSWWYLVRYWRFLRWRLRNRHVVTEGFVFLGRRVELSARKGYGRLVVGRWVHLGDGNAVRCHEGNLRIGDKVVFGRSNTVNGFLDIEIGEATIVADWVYVCDFDHVYEDINVPIKDQGIVKTPVRIGPDCWVGTKASVLRGASGRPRLRARRAHGRPRRGAADVGGRGGSRPRGQGPGRRRTTRPPPAGRPWPTSPARPTALHARPQRRTQTG